jgi:hypothetical protein
MASGGLEYDGYASGSVSSPGFFCERKQNVMITLWQTNVTMDNYGTSPFLMGKSTISTRPWLPVRFLFSRLPGRLTSHERSPLVDTGPTRAFPSGNRPLHGGLHSSLPGLCVPQRTIKFHSTAMTKGQLTRHSVNQASRIQYCHSIIDMIIE